MTLERGMRLGPYEILDPLGSGGMGEVYRARDTKLDREVAVKVLPAEFAADPERLSRFEREAKAVAALSHPNILAIHDFGSADGRTFAVMEYLEGETLRDRLGPGAIPERKAVEIAAQIAQGLAAAHAKEIVHRDLKPDNVMITPDGRVKILDFGLAKVSAVESDKTYAQTLAHATDPGRVLGTVGYMAPEQVRGEKADSRSDLFALGVILYEMLAGQRAFARESAVETMTAILKEDVPEFASAGTAVSASLDRIVRRCLEKRPEERFQSARDLAFALSHTSGSATGSQSRVEAVAVPAASRGRFWMWGLPVATLGIGLALGLSLGGRKGGPVSQGEFTRIQAMTFSGRDFEPSASPDGRMVAFTSDRDGTPRIWIKQLVGGGEAPLTEGPDRSPKFSPDGSSVLFLRLEQNTASAYRTTLVGGQPRKIVSEVLGARWSPDGAEIAFWRAKNVGDGRVSSVGIIGAHGGTERTVYEIRNKALGDLQWSPDGSSMVGVLSTATGNSLDSLVVIDLETGRSRTMLLPGTVGPITLGSWNGGSSEMLVAQSSSPLGDQATTLSRVAAYDPGTEKDRTLFWTRHVFPNLGGGGNAIGLDILASGQVIYGEMSVSQNLEETPLGRGVGAAPLLLTQGQSRDRQPAYSADGEHVIFSSNRSGNLDLWTISTGTGAVRQLTDDAAQDWDPAFTPDGKNILWSSDRSGNLEIWMADADGGNARQVSQDGWDAENPTMGRDNEWIIYWSANPEKLGLWKIRPDGSEATHLVQGPHYGPEVSPDGRYTTFLEIDPVNLRNIVHVVEVGSGRVLPLAIPVQYHVTSAGIAWGRNRWTPDGRSILFVGEDEDGLTGIYAQDFDPGGDTSATRRKVAGFSPLYVTESFGIAPDGARLTISKLLISQSIMLADGVPGVTPAKPRLP